MLQSLQEANSIFRSTDFDNDGYPDNIGFKAKYIIILQSEQALGSLLPPYSNQPIDGRFYLRKLSQHEILSEVCLGIAFTAQPFLNRVLGMSFTAVKNKSFDISKTFPTAGGICEKPLQTLLKENFNTLVITYGLENNEKVPQIISDISLAHELGHSFGSDHDGQPLCAGYLMSPHTSNETVKYKALQFSSCSKQQMSYIIKERGHCLEPTYEPFCGNG